MKFSFFIGAIFFYSSIVFGAKYNRGDCITPSDPTYSWYKQLALVEAFSSVDGYNEKIYILAFPFYGSSSVLFGKSIENATYKVDPMKCKK